MLIDANRSLLGQIEAKSQEIKQLRELILHLEATTQQNQMAAAAAAQLMLIQNLNNNAPTTSSNSNSSSGSETPVGKQQSPTNSMVESATTTTTTTTRKTDTDSLQELIVNYLSLIKSYKQLVEQLDQARIDNSELKISFNSLNKKYMRLKSNGGSGEEEENGGGNSEKSGVAAVVAESEEIDIYKSLIEEKYKQQISNLKSAYNQMYELYEKFKKDSIENYNRLHSEYLSKTPKLANSSPTESNDML